MQTVKLFIDNIEVDIAKYTPINIKYALKDIKNYGQRNSSASKPISVLKTPISNKVFKSLSNVNVAGGYNINKKYDGRLEVNGITILKGTVMVDSIKEDTYEVVLSNNNINLFNELGDDLIVGNVDSTKDIHFDDYEYNLYTMSRKAIRDSWNTPEYKSVIFPLNDYYGDIEGFQSAKLNYPILPSLKVLPVLKKIFERKGYSYELSPRLRDYIENLYIPYNNTLDKIATVNKPLISNSFGRYQEGSKIVELRKLTRNLYGLQGVYLDMCYDNTKNPTDAFNLITPDEFSYYGNYDSINVQSRGKTTFTLNLEARFINKGERNGFVVLLGQDFATGKYMSARGEIKGEKADVGDGGRYVTYQYKFTFDDINPNFIWQVFIESDEWDVDEQKKPILDFQYHTGNTCSWMKVSQDWLYDGRNISENEVLPINYKQSDLVNDILKSFNIFIDVDTNDDKKLFLYTRDEYYDTNVTVDISNVINEPTLTIKNISAEIANNNIFKMSDNEDTYNTDYKTKGDNGMYGNVITNDSDFAVESNSIELSYSPTAYKTLWDETYGAGSDNSLMVSKFINPNPGLITNIDNRLLFARYKRFPQGNTGIFGTDVPPAQAIFSNIFTLSPSYKYIRDNTDNCFLGFNSQEYYKSNNNPTYVHNQSLYNKFYKDEFETLFKSKLITVKANLKASFINALDFSDKYFISNKQGTSYYILNSINNYNPVTCECDIELIYVNPIVNKFVPSLVPTKIITLTTIEGEAKKEPAGTASTGTISGGGSGGGGGTTDEHIVEVVTPLLKLKADLLNPDFKGVPTVESKILYHQGNINKKDVDFTAKNLQLNGDDNVNVEMLRTAGDGWKLLNSNKDFVIQNNYTTAVGNYFDVMRIKNNTGDAIFKGIITCPGLNVGAITAASAIINNDLTVGKTINATSNITSQETVSAKKFISRGVFKSEARSAAAFIGNWGAPSFWGLGEDTAINSVRLGGCDENGLANTTRTNLRVTGNLLANTDKQVWDAGNSNRGDVNWNAKSIFLNRAQNSGGISYYAPTYNTWQTYMSNTTTNQGVLNNITAPSGTYVKSWALRSVVENSDNYGWTWESMTNNATTPNIMAELSSTTGSMLVAGWLSADKGFKTKNFSGSGLTAVGACIDSNGDINCRNLTIRGSAYIYELVINKIRATNGAIAVTDAGTVASVNITTPSTATIFLEDTNVFMPSDTIRCQAWTGTSVKSYMCNVIDVYDNAIDISMITGVPANIAKGDTIVRWDSDVDGRGGLVYITSSDIGSPSIQVLNHQEVKAQMGHLQGLDWLGIPIQEGVYGFWAEDAYLKGFINATAGRIGEILIENGGMRTPSNVGNRYNVFNKQNFGTYDESKIKYINQFNYTGSGCIATDGIVWDDKGKITFADRVSLQWAPKENFNRMSTAKWKIGGDAVFNIFDYGSSSANGSSNSFQYGQLNNGSNVVCLYGNGNTAAGGNSGWNAVMPNMDSHSSYKYSVWVYTSATTGSIYHGCSQGGEICTLAGVVDTNPYGCIRACNDVKNSWKLYTFTVHAKNYTGGTREETGVYNLDGSKVAGGATDFKWAIDNADFGANWRSYLYYASDGAVYFYNPTLYKIDGTEPTARQMIDSFEGRDRTTKIDANGIYTGTLECNKLTTTYGKITTAQIGDAQIGNAQISNLSADRINAGQLNAQYINCGSITSLGNVTAGSFNIGNNNFIVAPNGDTTMRNANVTGVINATSGNFTGNITALSGIIANFNITNNTLTSNALILDSDVGNINFYGNANWRSLQSGIGVMENIVPNVTFNNTIAAAYFKNTNNKQSYNNIGVYVESKNSGYNVGIKTDGKVVVEGGIYDLSIDYVEFVLPVDRTIAMQNSRRFFCYNNSGSSRKLYLPSPTEVINNLFINSNKDFFITIEIYNIADTAQSQSVFVSNNGWDSYNISAQQANIAPNYSRIIKLYKLKGVTHASIM